MPRTVRVLLALAALVMCGSIFFVVADDEPEQLGSSTRERRSEPTAAHGASDAAALEFFNSLSGALRIDLTEKLEAISPELLNMKAPPSARIKSVELELEVPTEEDFRALTEEERDMVVLRRGRVRLRGEANEEVFHDAPNGEHFTVRDLWMAIEETERQTRGRTTWFGGIDAHHVFFEGLVPNDDGSWSVRWGS